MLVTVQCAERGTSVAVGSSGTNGKAEIAGSSRRAWHPLHSLPQYSASVSSGATTPRMLPPLVGVASVAELRVDGACAQLAPRTGEGVGEALAARRRHLAVLGAVRHDKGRALAVDAGAERGLELQPRTTTRTPSVKSSQVKSSQAASASTSAAGTNT